MEGFIQKYNKDVIGVLNGWDRLMIRGTLRTLAVTSGMMSYLFYVGVLLKNIGEFVEDATMRVKLASLAVAERLNRPVVYLNSTRIRKEERARQIAQADGIDEGLICILTCTEPCMSYSIRRDRRLKKLILEPTLRKCLHVYHYWMDRDFGLMHGRLQTWFPFSIQVCLNGRSWLGRQMDRLGMGYHQRENCFVWLEDVPAAQRLMDQLLKMNWPQWLSGIGQQVNPELESILNGYRVEYYWSAYETEWASDVMFSDPAALARIYPLLARGAISSFGSDNVMRFLGKKLCGQFKGEVVSSYRRRPEGLRVKHSVRSNSVKVYDKQGSILRVETTINDPRDLKVYRTAEGDPGGVPSWRRMRKGVVDLRRRSELSQACNERYYEALAGLDTDVALGELIGPICRPRKFRGHRVRALRPWSPEDLALFRAISRGEHTVTGFRNRDLVSLLHGTPSDPVQRKRLASRVGHRLRLLRAHGIIRKVSRTHRYQLTRKGRQIVTAILQAQATTVAKLTREAA